MVPSVVPPDGRSWNSIDNPLEAWDGNILDAFEQYLDSTPNLDPASYGSQRNGGGEQPPATRQSSGDSHSHPELSKTMSSNERKQQNNRAAQVIFPFVLHTAIWQLPVLRPSAPHECFWWHRCSLAWFLVKALPCVQLESVRTCCAAIQIRRPANLWVFSVDGKTRCQLHIAIHTLTTWQTCFTRQHQV